MRQCLPAGFTLAALLLVAMPAGAGKLESEPFVSYRLERDSNLFRYETPAVAEAATGSRQRDELIQRYGAGMALRYSYGMQKYYLGGEVRRFNYQRNENLDYNGRELAGGMDWRLGHLLNGEVRLKQERRSESFTDRDSKQLSLQTDSTLQTRSALAMTPRWALQGTLDAHRLRNTLAASSNYEVNETTGGLALAYTGLPVGGASVGVDRLHGRYPNRDGTISGQAVSYDQTTLKLAANWSPSGLSTLKAEGGYTRRSNEGLDVRGFTGFTGAASYERKWSGKTRLRAELFRRVNNVEFIDANYEAETGAGLGLEWQLLSKLAFTGALQVLRDSYQGSPAQNVAGEPRRDTTRTAQAGFKYEPFFWLTLKPALAYEERDSNRANRSYKDTRIGVELEARYD